MIIPGGAAVKKAGMARERFFSRKGAKITKFKKYIFSSLRTLRLCVKKILNSIRSEALVS
jgi:hypothetical protein